MNSQANQDQIAIDLNESRMPPNVPRVEANLGYSNISSSMQLTGLSIIIPVYNEITTIEAIIERVLKLCTDSHWNAQLLVVDDGSTDGTAERMKQFSTEPRVKLLAHSVNQGKGAAIRTALGHATKEFTVIQDADLEYDPQQIACLIAAMHDKKGDVIYGSRVLGARAQMSAQRRNIYALGVVALNLTVRVMYGRWLTDEATCYKLIRTKDLLRMELACQGFEFCPEVTSKAIRLGLSIVEIPISYNPRLATEGKKIRLKDAFIAIQTLWKFRNWKPSAQAPLRRSHTQSR